MLCHDLEMILHEYLPLDDSLKYNFITKKKWTFPKYLEKIQAQRIIQAVLKKFPKLKDLGQQLTQDPLHLFRMMSKQNLILSGSLVLQAMLGEDWGYESDADLYMTMNNLFASECKECMVSKSFFCSFTKHTKDPRNQILDFFWEACGQLDDAYGFNLYPMKGIDTLKSYNLGTKQKPAKMQCIFIQPDSKSQSIPQWIQKTFDFTLLCNTFDGTNVTIMDLKSIAFRRLVATRESQPTFSIGHAGYFNAVYRTLKYQARGFHAKQFMVPDKVHIELYESRYSTPQKRIFCPCRTQLYVHQLLYVIDQFKLTSPNVFVSHKHISM